MALETPIVFRFNIFPFLESRILPIYQETLKKESNLILVLSDEERVVLEKYIKFLEKLYSFHYEISNSIDLRKFHPVFEIMERQLRIFSCAFNKLTIKDFEKINILNYFEDRVKPIITHILS